MYCINKVKNYIFFLVLTFKSSQKKMKHIIRGSISLVFVMVICVSTAKKKTSPISGILEMANSALSLITAICELFETSTKRNELEHLMKDVLSLKKNLEDSLRTMQAKMDQNVYKNIQLRRKIV